MYLYENFGWWLSIVFTFTIFTFVTKSATFPEFVVATRKLCTYISYLVYFRFEMFNEIQLYYFLLLHRACCYNCCFLQLMHLFPL
jgi:hypothetical protein